VSAVVDPDPIDRGGRLPHGMVTFAFTDIEGSTQRWERDAPAMGDALRRHDALVRTAIVDNGGYVFKTIGDAFCAAFSRPEDAVAAMLAAQHALATADFSAVDGIRVRAAIHTGTAEERHGDYFGPVVNRVARLLTIGHGGQILVSGVASEVVRGRLPLQTSLRSLGDHRLKDLSKPEAVFELEAPGLTSNHPALRSLDAHPNNLPVSLTAFFGRTDEIAEITGLLGANRIVTLVGSGGIGKTRTSLQVAADVPHDYADGVWLIELAPLTSGDYIAGSIATELGLALSGNGDPLADLVRALTAKNALIVFDNCEHLIDAAAHAATAILRNCANIKILASSRQALGIAGEQTYRLPSLAVPHATSVPIAADDAARSPAVAMFVERARAIDRTFELTDVNAAIVVDICRRLDGIALAIELAAARVKLLSPLQLRDRLDKRFSVLTGGARGVLPRQQTLRALIDWSHDLLDERERAVFRRLGIFVDGFSLEAAVAVAGGADLDEFDILELVGSLVDKSLVLAETAGEAQRYRLLESTRAYALERLGTEDEFEATARLRASFFEAFARDVRTTVADPAKRTMVVESELENFRDALKWMLEERHDVVLGARLARALGLYWSTKLPQEGLRWMEMAFDRVPEDADPALIAELAYGIAGMLPHGTRKRMTATEVCLEKSRAANVPQLLTRAFSAYGEQLAAHGRLEEAEVAHREALERAEAADLTWDTARALAGLSTTAVDRGDFIKGRTFGLRAIALFESIGANDGVGYCCITLGAAEANAGNLQAAIELVRRGRTAWGEIQNHRTCACAANNLSTFALVQDDVDEAYFQGGDALALLKTDRHPLFLADAVGNLAHVSTLRGDARRGAILLGFAENVYREQSFTLGGVEQRCSEAHHALLIDALGSDELARCKAQGALLAPDAAYDVALTV
jgi:predicted ATPase/class 3 adenylate cyclase